MPTWFILTQPEGRGVEDAARSSRARFTSKARRYRRPRAEQWRLRRARSGHPGRVLYESAGRTPPPTPARAAASTRRPSGRAGSDVDRVVLPVRAHDADHDRGPAPEGRACPPSAARARRGAPPVELEVAPLPLLDAVDEDLERPRHVAREDGREFAGTQPSGTFIEWQRPCGSRSLPLVALAARLLATQHSPADGGFAPVTPNSPNAHGITRQLPVHLDLRRRRLRPRRGLLVAFVWQYRRRSGARVEEAADPRRDEARARVDARCRW